MSRIAKLLAVVGGALIVLIAVALIVLTLVFDPNDYKDQIVTAVNDATGRTLTLEGDLELKVFPRVRIALGPAQISNAAGFGDAPFARIEAAQLDLALWPLITGSVRIGEARLEGLTLNLARNARGNTNWQDLAAAQSTSEPSAPPPAAAERPLELNVDTLQIGNAAVRWTDATNGTRWALNNLNLTTSDFGPGKAFPLALDFKLAGEAVTVGVSAKMQATLSLADNRYRLENLAVDIDGDGEAWPGGQGEASVQATRFDADLGAETLDLENLSLTFLGLTASGNLQGAHLMSNLTLAGAIDIAEFDPRDVLDAFGVDLQTADTNVLHRAQAHAQLTYDARQMMLTDLALTLDDSSLRGSAGMRNETIALDLNIDDINLDRYLPPSEEGGASEDEGSLDAVDLPIEVLKTLRASGQLAIGRAQFIGLTLTDARFALTAGNGELRLTPQAALYGGRYAGDVRIKAEGDSARINVQSSLTGVDMAPLAQDLLGEAMVSGTGEVKLNLAAAGSNLGAVRRGLDGDVAFTIADGAWEGMDLWYELRRARAVFDGKEAPSREGPRRTEFSRVAASGAIEDAILTNRDLTATLPFLTVKGAGTANLLTDAINFDLTARFVDGPALQSDPAMVSLAGQELPLKVGGSLSEPSVTPDFSALVRARVESKVQEKVEERTQDLKDRLQDRLRNLRDRN